MKRSERISRISICSMNAAILVICSFISVPTAPPFTFQSFGVLILTGLFGLKITLVSYMIYLLLGIVGLPVFSGFTGGFSVIIGPTGGYLIGFAFLIIVSSALINVLGRGIFSLTLAFTVGVIVLYVIATVYYSAVWLKDTSLSSVISSASVCVLPFLLADAAKTALAVYIVKCFEGRLRV